MTPQPAPHPDETAEQRRNRQLAMLRELAELNMRAARDAEQRVQQARATDDPAAADDATLALARATRAVTALFNTENRIAAGELPPEPAADNPRRLKLRQVLYPLAATEPDPARRTAARRQFDRGIENALALDPDDDILLGDIAAIIAEDAGYTLDFATLPDHLLFDHPIPRHPGPSHPGPSHPDHDPPSHDPL